MKLSLILALEGLALYIPSTLHAQTAPDAQACELRIITTDNVQVADSTNFKDGGLIGGLLTGLYEKQDPLLVYDIARDEVGEVGQKRLMNARLIDLPPRFSDYITSFETGGQRPLAAFQAAKRSGRISASAAPCLAEIAVVAATYIRTSLSRTFSFAFLYRQFGAGNRPEKVVSFGSSQKVDAFPPKSSADVPAARAELRMALEKAISGLFARIAKTK